eukprot:6177998-Ditylum_brightwellii.AAC.1
MELGMTRDRFAFLWCHFYAYKDENIEEEINAHTTSDSDEVSDDNLQELNLERVQQEQEEEDDDDKSDVEDNNETNEEEDDE